MRIYLIACFLAMLTVSEAMAKDWYVDGKNGNDGNPGTQAAPFRTGWKGTGSAKPGDTVHLLPTATYTQFGIQVSGTASAPITIQGDGVAPNLTQIVADGSNFGFQITNGASYIVFKNFNVQAPGAWSAIYVGNGSAHVTITGNTAYNSGLCGISTYYADYLTISYNTVYGNAHNTSTGDFCSGISTYEDWNSDFNTGIKNYVVGNIVYDNSNTPTCNSSVCYNGGDDSDGNGIILDDSRHTQKDNVVYNGKTLIENNIVFNNGGRGIYIYLSDHALVVNNTVYHNNWDPYEAAWRPGEIGVEGGGGDIQIYNNIAYSTGNTLSSLTGALAVLSIEDANDGVGSVTADYNLLYNMPGDAGNMYFTGQYGQHTNSNSVTFGAHNLFANPNFVNLATNPSTANFHLQNGSRGLASSLASMAAPTDITGTTRPTWDVDMGVYQQTIPPQCGSANGVPSLLAPVAGLCSVGTASAASLLNGLWAWTCTATDGGVYTNCSSSSSGATLNISVVASGDDYQGDPIMGILVNGTQVTTSTVTAVHSSHQWQTFTYTLSAPSSLQNIGVSFTNDASGSAGDRNLYVQSITVNGVTLTPPQGTYTHWGTSQTGTGMLWTTGTLIWNASLL